MRCKLTNSFYIDLTTVELRGSVCFGEIEKKKNTFPYIPADKGIKR